MIISRKKLEEYKQTLIENTIREENDRHFNEQNMADMWRHIHELQRDLNNAKHEINKLNMILEVNGLTRKYNTIGCDDDIIKNLRTPEVNPIHE